MAEAGNVKERIQALENKTSDALADLEAEVTETRSVGESVVTLLQGLSRRLQDAIDSGNITERVIAIKRQLDEHNDRIRDAIIANTPAENPPEEDEEEIEEDEETDPNDPQDNSRRGIDDAVPNP